MKRLLLDQGLAPAAAELLRERGFDAVHVAEIGMDRAEDTEILALARDEGRICVTLDHDFHSHLALTGTGAPSVVLLRVEGLPPAGQSDLIRAVYLQCETALTEGAAVSADMGASVYAVYRCRVVEFGSGLVALRVIENCPCESFPMPAVRPVVWRGRLMGGIWPKRGWVR